MNSLGPWNIDDFDSMSWHDVHVHGFRFESIAPDEGTADLVLDIDYILKWDQIKNEFFFTVCRAELVFHKVFGFKFSLDYATPTAGMCAFSMNGIEREPLIYPTGLKSFSWLIPINWPHGSMEFESPSFSQRLTGDPIVQQDQGLSSVQRGGYAA